MGEEFSAKYQGDKKTQNSLPYDEERLSVNLLALVSTFQRVSGLAYLVELLQDHTLKTELAWREAEREANICQAVYFSLFFFSL